MISAAVPADNPELAAARAAGTPVMKRAAAAGRADGRAGRRGRGRARTARRPPRAMIAWVLRAAGRDPAFLVGGVLPRSGHRRPLGRRPRAGGRGRRVRRLLLGVAAPGGRDHQRRGRPSRFLSRPDCDPRRVPALRGEPARPAAVCCLCGDDAGARALLRGTARRGAADRQFLLYGSTPDCAWQATDAAVNDQGGSDFRVLQAGQEVAQVRLRLPGRHNVLNALGALGAAVALGVAPADAAAALGSFAGTGRRIEVKGSRRGRGPAWLDPQRPGTQVGKRAPRQVRARPQRVLGQAAPSARALQVTGTSKAPIPKTATSNERHER